ncbi:MAG: DUF2806 domain-containing protein [Selenomonas ruminantium]|nr:DUF2806 domain-containing protein [Selenomonas ruminantium]
MDDFSNVIATIQKGFGKELINKIFGAVSTVYNDSDYINTKRAKHQIMKEISEDARWSALERYAIVDNIDTISKQFANVLDICKRAGEIMNQSDRAKDYNNLDEEWVAKFKECSKNASSDNIRQMWAKLLAERVENNKGITKSLLNTLSLLESYQAKCFTTVSAFRLILNDGDEQRVCVIFPHDIINKYFDYVTFDTLVELDNLGLIRYSHIGRAIIKRKMIHGIWENRKISIANKDDIPEIVLGKINLTHSGETLASIIAETVDEKIFVDVIGEYCQKCHYDFQIE